MSQVCFTLFDMPLWDFLKNNLSVFKRSLFLTSLTMFITFLLYTAHLLV